jgi:phosphomannomutase
MIRPSGTEPVLRIYSESENYEKVIAILDATKSTVLAI